MQVRRRDKAGLSSCLSSFIKHTHMFSKVCQFLACVLTMFAVPPNNHRATGTSARLPMR
eukprot:m.352314 g.352314  ORF g.352314 m.352314 type:complete len:59 (-) comp16487_c0_seq1:60-236(-)